MSRILAVDWDQHEARYVLAEKKKGGGVALRAVMSVPLVDVVVAGSEPHPDLGNSLRSALEKEKLGRATTLLGVARASIETLHLELPPAKDSELPAMVANEAMREVSGMTDGAIIDYMAIAGDASGPRRVTAAVMTAEALLKIRETSEAAGLKPNRLLLRPYATASLYRQTIKGPDKVCLLVNLVADEVDLTIVDQGQVTFFRTIRLPQYTDPKKASERVVAEIQRTLAIATQSTLRGDPVETLGVFGQGDEHAPLIARLEERLGLSVTSIDPFASVTMECPLPEGDTGRFASLLGMVLDEARTTGSATGHAIDFLHPRREAKPTGRRRLGMIAAALVLVGLVGGFHVWSTLEKIDADNAVLRREYSNLGSLLKKADTQKRAIAVVRQWQADEVNWLEELRDLSLRLPQSKDAVMLRMSMAPVRGSGGGVITLQGRLADSSTIRLMEQCLRDKYHGIRTPPVRAGAGDENYPWSFNTSVTVKKRSRKEYTRHLAGALQ